MNTLLCCGKERDVCSFALDYQRPVKDVAAGLSSLSVANFALPRASSSLHQLPKQQQPPSHRHRCEEQPLPSLMDDKSDHDLWEFAKERALNVLSSHESFPEPPSPEEMSTAMLTPELPKRRRRVSSSQNAEKASRTSPSESPTAGCGLYIAAVQHFDEEKKDDMEEITQDLPHRDSPNRPSSNSSSSFADTMGVVPVKRYSFTAGAGFATTPKVQPQLKNRPKVKSAGRDANRKKGKKAATTPAQSDRFVYLVERARENRVNRLLTDTSQELPAIQEIPSHVSSFTSIEMVPSSCSMDTTPTLETAPSVQ